MNEDPPADTPGASGPHRTKLQEPAAVQQVALLESPESVKLKL